MARNFKCRCCNQDAHTKDSRIGGVLSCGCESAICSVCKKCRFDCTCEWGIKARIEKLRVLAEERFISKNAKTVIVKPLRERIEEYLQLSGDALQEAILDEGDNLLRDALNQAETNFILYEAWVKRATEAEEREAELREVLESALRSLDAANDPERATEWLEAALDKYKGIDPEPNSN